MLEASLLWRRVFFVAAALGIVRPVFTQQGTDALSCHSEPFVSLLQKSAAIKDAGRRRSQAADYPRIATIGTLYGDCLPIANVRERLSMISEALPSIYDAVDVMVGLDRVRRDGETNRLREVEADSRTRVEQESFQHRLERAAIAFDSAPLLLGGVLASASAVAANGFADTAVVLVQKFLDDVHFNFTQEQAKVHAVVDDANLVLSTALQQFSPLRDTVLDNFSFAVDRVTDLCDSTFAQEDEKAREHEEAALQAATAVPATSRPRLARIRGWLRSLVHGKSTAVVEEFNVDDRFSRAEVAVLAANATVRQTSDMLDEFDGLASAQVIRVAAEARDGLVALRLLQPAALRSLTGELPLAVASILATQLDVAFDKVSSDVNVFTEAVLSGREQIVEHVSAARRDLSALFGAVAELMSMVGEARTQGLAARQAAKDAKEAVAARKVTAMAADALRKHFGT